MQTLFVSFQIMYKSQYRKIYSYDWFCGPGSHKIRKPNGLNMADWQIPWHIQHMYWLCVWLSEHGVSLHVAPKHAVIECSPTPLPHTCITSQRKMVPVPLLWQHVAKETPSAKKMHIAKKAHLQMCPSCMFCTRNNCKTLSSDVLRTLARTRAKHQQQPACITWFCSYLLKNNMDTVWMWKGWN